MNLEELLKKYDVPRDAAGTCMIQELKPKHVAYIGESKYRKLIAPNAGAYILVAPELYNSVIDIPGNTYIETPGVLAAFLIIHNTFHKDTPSFSPGDYKPKCGVDCSIDPTSKFGGNVVIGDRVVIHPHVVIGSNVTIGDDTKIYAGAAIYDRVRLGKRNTINANSTIGRDGYRIIKDEAGINRQLIHIGGVRFDDDVDFGNSSCIDRGTFGDTILERHVKIDNMVHIGHNVHVKENSLLAASCCIGGSTVIGKNCWIGIGATISNGLVIGDDASVLINAVVVRDVPEGGRVAGFYAMPNDAWRLLEKEHTKQFSLKVRKAEKKVDE
jgi:UDP-3-O-[3-hydroxymyristoyl] glucosamine N-acyltransferase LpxD